MRTSTLLLLAVLGLIALSMVSAAGKSSYSPSAREKLGKYQARIGPKFLEEKSKEPGVTTLPSGVRYKVLKAGEGKKSPGPSDQCKVHYEGRLISGKVFDSSFKRGSPATFAPSGVIAGWTELLQLMVEGDEWEVYIPSDKAYGSNGQGADIPPNSVLVSHSRAFRCDSFLVISAHSQALTSYLSPFVCSPQIFKMNLITIEGGKGVPRKAPKGAVTTPSEGEAKEL